MGKTRKIKNKNNKSKRVTQRIPRYHKKKVKKRKNKSKRKYKRNSKNKQKQKQRQTDITLSAIIKNEFYKLFN